MDPAWQEGGSSHGGEGTPYYPWPFRTFAHGPCHWGLNSHSAQDGKLSRVCRYFQRGFCFHGHRCSNLQPKLAPGPGEAVPVSATFSSPHSYQHLQPPGCLQWGRRHSEPPVPLPGPLLGLTRRGSEPAYLPSVAVGWAGASWDTELGPEGLASQNEELGGSFWKFLPPSSADGDHSHSQQSRPKPQPVQNLVASLQSMDPEREQDSRDVVCGICMDKVWDKPEAKRIFGILPNCSHAHCLGCLRTWRKRRQDFPLDVIKACPQCRVRSSYIIPHRFWVSKGAEKEQLIRNFKARTSQTPCRFFMRGNGRCPFKSDCIYLHQPPDEARALDPPYPQSLQLASGTEMVRGPVALLEDTVFPDYALAVAFWGFDSCWIPTVLTTVSCSQDHM